MMVRVRGGAQLPAHSPLLTSISPVLSDLLDAGASQVAAGSKTVLPLDDFTECEVINILKVRVC